MRLQWKPQPIHTPVAGLITWLTRYVGLRARAMPDTTMDTTANTLLDEPPIINERPYARQGNATSIGLWARSRIIG